MSSATKSYVPPSVDRLHTLEIAMDEERMGNLFAPIMKERFGEMVRVNEVNIEILRRRTQRCVLRYEVAAFDPDQAKDIKWHVIGKLLDADLGAKVYNNMRELWAKGFSREAEDGISIPEVLDFSPSLCMLLQEEVPGLPVRALLKQFPQTSHFRQLARTLVKLHKCPIVPGKPATVRNHLLRCHPRHEFLSLACPDLAPSIDYIVNRAYEIENILGDIELTPLHGDFHLGQVHLENGHAWLIDFDALSYGDPASDLGNVLVFLKGRAQRHPEINEIIQAFLDEYFSHMDPEIAARIPLYEALTQLRRACKALRFQEEGWESAVKRMVEQGVASIDEMANKLNGAIVYG
jgi:tRNA A-37 threonylcarbamoyl transferase component Bud32